MLRHPEMLSTCARVLLVGLLASCVESGDPASALDDSAAQAAPDETDVSRASDEHNAVALTTEGLIRGVATATTRKFLGIPYAAAPVGDLRWRPPQRHARWHGILDTTQFANHCPQPGGSFGQGSVTEDCLFLNVFTPRRHHDDDGDDGDDRDDDARGDHGDLGDDGGQDRIADRDGADRDGRDGDDGDDRLRLRPVMVWIHGGALVTGESNDYDATRLVEQGDVVVVTINY